MMIAALLVTLAAVRSIYEPIEPARGNVARFAIGAEGDWRVLDVEKRDGTAFRAWRHGGGGRYLLERGGSAIEYRHELTGRAVLPSSAPASILWPAEAGTTTYLGHRFRRVRREETPGLEPPASARIVSLRPDLWIGQASNTRQKDETRRYDGSDYELTPLAQADYRRMAEAGLTVVKAAAGDQQAWAEQFGFFFWGPLARRAWPELLYESQYLGPALFLDEPAVGTRDHDLRPRLAKETEFRKAITPALAFEEYRKHFAKTLAEGPPRQFMRELRQRKDVDLGSLDFSQQNLFNWETMPETAAYALSQDPGVPSAMVFEPPGRLGTRRTLPEWNMAYGTRFRTDDPRVLPAVIFGFLRGAARVTGKQWGVSIYGAVERADTFWWLTEAYDRGATRFFFWDNYQLACVPFSEVLALSRHLRAHARQHARIARPATEAIVLPPGYGLGHTHTGRGNLWGLPELNLERGDYRAVMSRFFATIEQSLRDGVDFDLFWDLPGLKLAGYGAPAAPPGLTVKLDRAAGGNTWRAIARVEQKTSPVYYTFGADSNGVEHNAMVLFELYGPGQEDYQFLMAKEMRPQVRQIAPGVHEVTAGFTLAQPGRYRLRAATADTAGRTTVVWVPIER